MVYLYKLNKNNIIITGFPGSQKKAPVQKQFSKILTSGNQEVLRAEEYMHLPPDA